MYKELLTERLKLRTVSVEDAEQVYVYSGDSLIAKHMIYLPSESLAETKEALTEAAAEWLKEKPEYHEFSVLLDRCVIGTVTLYYLEEPGLGELGWILNKEYWGHGYITEAAEAVIRYALEERGLLALIAQCDSRNAASYRVMEKLGFVKTKEDGIRYNRSESGRPSVELTYRLA